MSPFRRRSCAVDEGRESTAERERERERQTFRRAPRARRPQATARADVGIWVTLTLTAGHMARPEARPEGGPAPETRPVQEEESWWRGAELNCRHHDFQSGLGGLGGGYVAIYCKVHGSGRAQKSLRAGLPWAGVALEGPISCTKRPPGHPKCTPRTANRHFVCTMSAPVGKPSLPSPPRRLVALRS